jgi:hypothetical protein
VDSRIAVQQFPGGAVDVIDAAVQQDGLDAPACLPERASGEGKGGQRWYSSRRALAGGGGRAEADLCQVQKYRVCDDQRCDAATGLARLPAAQAVHWCGFGTVTGHSVHPPARHRTVIPRCGGSLMALIRLVSVISRQHLQHQAGHAERWMCVGCLDVLAPFASTVARHHDTLGSASEPVDCRLPGLRIFFNQGA